ncbi:MAG: RNA polymerase sigma factor FliA [Pseudomonadota bacterium]
MVVSTAYAQYSSSAQDELVIENAQLVKRIAYHLVSRLAGNVDVDDLIQAGMIGLLEASRKYDASRGANFQTFAGIRIRGAMLDEVRRSDWTPRSVYQKLRKVTEAMRAVEMRHGRSARESEVAEELGLGLDEYHKVLRDATTCRLFSLEQTQSEGSHTQPAGDLELGPQESASEEEFRLALADAISKLPEREALVLSLYYDDELNLREIGEVLQVSESRVSQIHSKAVVRLRARLGEWTG